MRAALLLHDRPGRSRLRSIPAILFATLLTSVLLAPAASAQADVLPASPYHTYATMQQDLQALADANPDLVRFSVLGETPRGLELWRVDVADMTDPGWERRPALVVDGGHHGNEILGMEAAYYFIESLVDAHHADAGVLDGKRVVVVPVVNPDGWVQDSRVNGNLVNLNRNYPWMWNERGADSPTNNAGPSPASEVETQLMMDLMAEGDVRGYVTFHTGSFDLVLPWSPEDDAPIPDWDLYALVLTMAEEETGLGYRDPSATGESHAHAYGNLGIFGILPEVSTEQNLLVTPEDVRGKVTEGVAIAHLWLSHLLDLGGRLEVVATTSGTVTLRNVGLGNAYAITTSGGNLAELAPGTEATLPVNDCGDVQYLRLNLPDVERPPKTHFVLEGRLQCVEETNDTPAPGAGGLVAALAAVALALRRRV